MGSIPTRSRHPGLGRPERRGKRRAVLRLAAACGLGLAVGLAPSGGARAQQPDSAAAPESLARPDTGTVARPDTGAAVPDTAAVAGRGGPADSSRSGLPVSPLGAFARSLVLPGWGQAAAGKPVRGAFYFAAEAGSLFMVIKSQQKLSAARVALAAGHADQSLVDSRVAQREDWIVLSVFWALLSGVDAWVTANLADFQQPLVPPPDGTPGAAIRVRVPVGGP